MTAIKFHIEVIIGGVLINSRTHSAGTPRHQKREQMVPIPISASTSTFSNGGQHVYHFGSLGALFFPFFFWFSDENGLHQYGKSFV